MPTSVPLIMKTLPGFSASLNTKPFTKVFLSDWFHWLQVLEDFLLRSCCPNCPECNYFSYRRNCFLLINAIYVVLTFGLMIKNVYTLIICRLIQGCLSGVFSSLVPLYIKEFSPLELNGKMGTFYQMLNVLGLSIAFFVSYICSLLFTP